MKVKRTYRLEEETADKISKLAVEFGTTATGVIERAIQAYGSVTDACHTEYAGNSKAVSILEDEVELLRRQLDIKDSQIEMLGLALSDAQATAKGAQALHAASTHAVIESPEHKNRTSRLQRLIEAWRG